MTTTPPITNSHTRNHQHESMHEEEEVDREELIARSIAALEEGELILSSTTLRTNFQPTTILESTVMVTELEEGQVVPQPPSIVQQVQADTHEVAEKSEDDSADEISALIHTTMEDDSLISFTHMPSRRTIINNSHPSKQLMTNPVTVESITTPQFIQLSLPTEPPSHDSSTEVSLWSLPLPTRIHPPTHPSSSSASSASLPPHDPIRARLVELQLPLHHIDAVMLERDQHLVQESTAAASSSTSSLPIEHWIDRCMDRMWKEEHESTKELSSVAIHLSTTIPITTSTPSLPTHLPAPSSTLVNSSTSPICGICFDPLPDDSTQSPCKHSFCPSCWNGYLVSKILANQVLFIRCPHITPEPCQRFLSSTEIVSKLRTDEMKSKYTQLEELAQASRDPSKRWCPTPGCSTLITNHDTDVTRMTCPTCTKSMCFKCGSVWHDGLTCSAAASVALQQFIASTPDLDIKSCPMCSEGIQRIEGCNFIRCPRCSNEFCWICLGPYTDYHYAWWNLRGCPLMHLSGWSWLGDDTCCGLRCSSCLGALKRGLTKMLLVLIYLLVFCLLLPFLILVSPYLIYRYCHDRPARERRQQLQQQNRELTRLQFERAQLKSLNQLRLTSQPTEPQPSIPPV